MTWGIDFDNTLVDYSSVFHRVGRDLGLVPPEAPIQKQALRDFLRAADREDDWTELQGHVYGERIRDAQPYPGAREFMERCRAADIPVYVISHKTQYPFAGPRCDLRNAARDWLDHYDFSPDARFFEPTAADKVARIREQGCTHFVDDLPEFLLRKDFPPITRIHFAASGSPCSQLSSVESWSEISW
jgi:hypothetical protein